MAFELKDSGENQQSFGCNRDHL